MVESQGFTQLAEHYYDDPSQLSQLLRQRASSNQLLHFTTSTESHQSGITASAPAPAAVDLHHRDPADPSLQLPVATARFDHALSTRRVATARYVKPALSTTHSAPTSTGFVMDREGALRMHRSFGGIDAPGDTQPDSQMHRQWSTGAIHSTEETVSRIPDPPKSLFVEHVEDEEDGDILSDEMEVVRSSQERQGPTITSPTAVQEDDDFGLLPPHTYAPTSPLKFETPAIAGRKRDSSGQLLSSAMRTNTTPGTVISTTAFPGFGNGGIGAMSLTQLYNNTQAPTSPIGVDATEDAAFTRPSPNFSHVRQSSPIPALSSPIKAVPPETPRTDPVMRSSSEPRTEYVSLKESQERRKRTMREQMPPALEHEDSWDLPSAAQLRLRKMKAKEDLERKAAMSFANVSAPVPISPRTGRRRMVYNKPSEVVPRTPQVALRPPLNGDASADEISRPTAVNDIDEDELQDKLSQPVPRTTRAGVEDDDNHSVQVPQTSSHAPRTSKSSPDTSSPSPPQHDIQCEGPVSTPRPSKESVAIMDSQPDATANYESIPRPKSLRFPSSPSINQYSINQTTMATKTGFTSQVISSSMPPMPPRSSSEETGNVAELAADTEDNEDRVPSSPPILAHEDDLTYDEHEQAYNEYAEGDGVDEEDEEEERGEDVRNSTEPQHPEEDTAMNDADSLPTLKEEPGHRRDNGRNKPSDDEGEELDLVQPQKVDLGTDQGIPDMFSTHESYRGKDNNSENKQHHNGNLLQSSRRAMDPPCMQRRDTVPETDALEETQPSFFPINETITAGEQKLVDAASECGGANQTNSTEPFHTAQEQQTGSQDKQRPPASSREDGSDIMQASERLQSMQDIYNLPDTQQSPVEEEFEMPRLSGLDEVDETHLGELSPAIPSAKRRKITYTAKRNVPRSPTKSKSGHKTQHHRSLSPAIDEVQNPKGGLQPNALGRGDEEARVDSAKDHQHDDVQALQVKAATLKSKTAPRRRKPLGQKKGSLKPVTRELLKSLSSPGNSPAKMRSAASARAVTPGTPSKRSTDGNQEQGDIEMPDRTNDRDELAGLTSEPVEAGPMDRNASVADDVPTGKILVSNRVFASWPGSHYYPATCLGRASGRQLQIRFDDGNTTALDPAHVRALDLRPGDQVKVDETGMKKHTYIIVGFKDKIDDLVGEEYTITDRQGYATIVLEEKQRDSLSVTRAGQSTEQLSVPLGSIYLTTQLWTRLRDRSFNFSPPASPSKSNSRVGTPAAHMDLMGVTPSFSRKGTAAPSLLRDVTARAGSVASSSARSGSTTFSNMAFVLTSTAADIDKDTIAKTIKSNGGQVLEHGFHELFDLDPDVAASPLEGRHRSVSDVEGSAGLKLKQLYHDLGFVALISDSFSRSTKYIQALALNVPCLHVRWVQDSLAASLAVPFAKYLLPAGVSKFLDAGGVVRSRTMTTYDPSTNEVSFARTVAERDLLLRDQSVLLVTGKSKKEIEKRQPFVFLTHALGSASVGRCADLNGAQEMLATGQWDWIYVDNGEQGVSDAAAELFASVKPTLDTKPKKSKHKKRRDIGEEKEELVARGQVHGKKVKITCSEFVIQSLILGALVEQ